MGWISRDFECAECHNGFSEIVATPCPVGAKHAERCKCGGKVLAVLSPSVSAPTLVVGSEAHDKAITDRARAHDKRVTHPEYFESRGEPVPRRFR